MEINRRQLICKGLGLAGGLLYSTAFTPSALAQANDSSMYASAYTTHDEQHFICITSATGQLLTTIATPSRAHSAAFSLDGKSLAFFARRPGRWLYLIDIDSGNLRARITSSAGRHFYGHGCFSADSRFIYASENDFDNTKGKIGVYDTQQNFAKVNEFDSGGIGPHELILHPDHNTIVVANGGIETHPDYGRRKLNLDSMQSNLSYIQLDSGQIVDQVTPPHHQLSMRHLTINTAGKVATGAQFQGDPRSDHPLVFTHQKGEALLALSKQPISHQRSLKQYIASVAFSDKGNYILSSSPKGDRVSVWIGKNNTWLMDLDLSDVGGIAPIKGSADMLLSSGNGSLYRWIAPTHEVIKLGQLQVHWDNHLVSSN